MGRVSSLCPFTSPPKNDLVLSFAQGASFPLCPPPAPLCTCLLRTIISSPASSWCISAQGQERDQRLDDDMIMTGCEQGGTKGARDCGVWNDCSSSHGQGRQEGNEDLYIKGESGPRRDGARSRSWSMCMHLSSRRCADISS